MCVCVWVGVGNHNATCIVYSQFYVHNIFILLSACNTETLREPGNKTN